MFWFPIYFVELILISRDQIGNVSFLRLKFEAQRSWQAVYPALTRPVLPTKSEWLRQIYKRPQYFVSLG